MASGSERRTRRWPRWPHSCRNVNTLRCIRSASIESLFLFRQISSQNGPMRRIASAITYAAGHPQRRLRWRKPSETSLSSDDKRDLEAKPGTLRYGKIVLPKGFYIVNINLVGRAGHKNTQIHKTQWDAIIVDEAHRVGNHLVGWSPHTLLANSNTATILLTATPFQLSPTELKGLLETTLGGYGDPQQWGKAKRVRKIYSDAAFQAFRMSMNYLAASREVSNGAS